MSSDYAQYIIYAIGYFSVGYILLLFLRHAILYYIVKTLLGLVKIVTKTDFKYSSKNATITDREDELKRDQKVEIFKQQASEIRKAMDKKKDGDDIIEVDIQRSGGESGQVAGKSEENYSKLSQTRERQNERIVGIVDQNALPKWQKMVFQKMFTELNQIAKIMVQNQVSSQSTTGYWTSYVTAKSQQEQAQSNGVGRKMGRGI
jgi:hypothetical protein